MEVVLAHGANPRVLHKRCRSHFELPSCTDRSGVWTGIINNNLKFHCRRIYALIPFDIVQLLRMGVTKLVEPGLIVETDRIHNKGIAVLIPSNRVTHQVGSGSFRIFWMAAI